MPVEEQDLYDIIGDIHGHHDKLEALLRRLGYRMRDGAWRHPGRQAIFVGDLIDRGPAQVETVNTVRAMVEAEAAQCILGNHEFNAVAWATPDPHHPGAYLRPHDEGHNRAQHQVFLEQVVEGSSLHGEIIDWFRTLPLWLELDGIRVVHACWHDPSLDWLGTQVQARNVLPESLYIAGSQRGEMAFDAVETVCKGLEVRLPDDISFTDRGGVVRKRARIRWWEPELPTFREAAIGPAVPDDAGMDTPFPRELWPAPYQGPPVFFGHYWMTGTPKALAPNAACLDYSVAGNGPLVAYRWDGEERLDDGRFVVAG